MNTEEKAEAYDKAIEGIQEILSSGQEFINMSRLKLRLQPFFPELKESEDEKVKQKIINLIKKSNEVGGWALHKWEADEMLAWLEKQGQKPVNDTDEGIVEAVKDTSILDMIQPKFKVGDWVVWDNKVVCNITGYINEDKKTLMYIITDTNGMERTYSFNGFDNNARLWDIKEVKDGDVLKEDSCTFIIERMKPDGTAIIHCCLFDDGDFDLGSTLSFDINSTKPATKEQRDTLMKAMADAGWEFNFKKKELKKIEQKPSDKVETKFHEGDWVVVSTIKGDRVVQIASVEYLKDGCPSYITTEGRWFGNRTKARLLTNKDVEITTIPESRAIVNKIKSWSKEDEDYYDAIIAKLEVTQDDAALTDNQMEFLKSLKQRHTWKPSEEQMRALHDMNLTGNISYAGQGQTLIELYNDLKKL